MKTNHKDYFDLINTIETIETSINQLKQLLDGILTDSNKEYTITHGNKTFHFYNPSDKYEKSAQDKRRSVFMNRIIKECIRESINQTVGAWDPIIAFTQGEDVNDHKFEMVREKLIAPELDNEGNPIKAKSLNYESVYVEWQDQRKEYFVSKGEDNVEMV